LTEKLERPTFGAHTPSQLVNRWLQELGLRSCHRLHQVSSLVAASPSRLQWF
jgi:hypothetical protein